MSENVVFLYITTEHLATNFLRAIRLGVGGLVQADGTYQTNWNGFPVIPLGTTDLAGQFHLIAHVVVSTENEVVYRSCWRSMVQMAAEYLTKEHATLLPLEDDNDASELPVLETLSRAQYYMTLYQDMLKETPSTPEERESVEEADEEAASHFQARWTQDEELQNREHVVKTTKEEFGDDQEHYSRFTKDEIYEALRKEPLRSMSDGAGFIGKAAKGIFNNDNFKALNCMTHIAVGSLGPGKSVNARFKRGNAKAKKEAVQKFRADFRLCQAQPTTWLKDIHCVVGCPSYSTGLTYCLAENAELLEGRRAASCGVVQKLLRPRCRNPTPVQLGKSGCGRWSAQP